MSEPAPAIVAPRYVARFSCIGSACESTCCAGWNIAIDADAHRNIRSALQQTKADRTLFDESVHRVRGPKKSQRNFALIVLDNEGDCRFLDNRKLCTLQARFGEKLLPDVCATYPRRQVEVGARTEMALSLSCPEAARTALLATDAMELVDLDADARRPLTVLIANAADPYEAALDLGRVSILEMIAGASSPAAGLGAVAALAEVLGDGFARGRALDAVRVEAVFADFRDPRRAQEIGAAIDRIDVPLDVPMAPLLRVVVQRFGRKDRDFEVLTAHAAAAYGIDEVTDYGAIGQRYRARRDAVLPLVGTRLDAMLRNYLMNHAFTSWFTRSPSFAIWVRGLIVRTALVRFFVFAHPDVGALVTGGSEGACPFAGGATEADARRTVERVTVEVVSRMGRAIEHNATFLEQLDVTLPAAMPGLEHALCLLKI